ncbi:MAG: ATP-binding cassette domain-containing protein [Alphaproteobacteria bacterium]|nr:ATP-binding cassette domain-containing protein [Alphaproteobacteria bacterium]
MDGVVLEVDDVHKRFGGLRAIAGVSFAVEAGQLLGLIGPNGAGKTTIFNMISGIYRTDRGRIRLQDHDITNRRPTQIAQLGVARTFQVPRTFNHMTVEENLLVPALRTGRSREGALARVAGLLREIGLFDRRYRNASELAGAERQLLQFARAIVTAPRLLILDELFAGASAGVVDLMIGMTRSLAERGAACLVISHDIVSLPRLCDEVIVLTEGSILTRGALAEVRQDPRVVEAYLGA